MTFTKVVEEPGITINDTCYAFLLKGMDGVVYGLCGTAQIPGDFFRALFSVGGKPDLAPTQGKNS